MAPGGGSDNLVQIAIQATDQATKIIDQTKASFLALGTGIAVAQDRTLALGAAITALTGTGIREIGRLGQVVELVKTTLNSPIAKGFLQSLGATADAALSEIQPLSAVLKSTSDLAGNFTTGLVKGSGESAVLKNVKRQIEDINKLQKTDPSRSGDFGLQARLQQLQQVEQSLEKKSTTDKFQDVSKKVSASLVESLVNLPIDKIPFVSKLFGSGAIASAIQPLDQALSSVVSSAVLSRKIPSGLKSIADNFGLDLTGAVKGISKNSVAISLLAQPAQELLKGSVLKALEAQIATTLDRGFNLGLTHADNIVTEFSGNLGKKLGTSIISSTTTSFDKFDSLFSGKIGVAIDKLAGNIAPKLTNKSGLVEGFRTQFGEVFNDVVATLALDATPITGGGNFLLHAFGDESTASTVKQITGGALVEVGAKLADVTRLTDVARGGFDKLFAQLLAAGAKSAIGGVFSQLTRGLDSVLPQQFKTAFGVIEQIFPQQIAQLKAKVLTDVESLFTGIVNFATLSPVERIGQQIEKLQGVASSAKESAAAIEQLQEAALQTVTRSDLTTGTKEALVEQLNGEIASVQSRLTEAQAAQKQVESLTQRQTALTQRPAALQEAAGQIAVDPSLPSEQKGKLVEGLNAEIAQAQNQLKSPLQRLSETISRTLSSGLGAGGGGGNGIAQQLLAAFNQADQFLEGTVSGALGTLGATAGRSFATNFGTTLLSGIVPALNRADDFILSTLGKIEAIPGKISGLTGSLAGTFGAISGAAEPLEVFNLIRQGVGGVSSSLFNVVQEIGFFTAGLQGLQQLVSGGPFDLLIGQNVKLREQMLATQSTLAGTNKVFQGGQQVTDPTQAIQALQGPVDAAIAKVRKGSLELVNVTSKDLIESFQIIAGQAGNIGFSLDQASKLTLSFGAALGTLGVPLVQARQEISSILTGQIDQNSVVAKSLGLTNQQIQLYRSQGTLVDKLLQKLSAFRAGNALAAQTLGGITSNIQEFADEIGRLAGEQLLDPIVKQLTGLYDYMVANKDNLVQLFSVLSADLLKIVESGSSAFQALAGAIGPLFSQIPVFLFNFLARSVEEFAQAVKFTVAALQPFLDILAQLLPVVIDYGGHFLKLYIQFQVLTFGIQGVTHGFGILSKILPGVGDLLFVLSGRTHPLLQSFTALQGVLGTGSAGFLLLGKNMGSIPGAAGVVTKALGSFGPLAGLITPLVPAIAGAGVQIAGIATKVPFLKTGLQELLALNPSQLANGLIGVGGQFKVLQPFIPTLRKLSDEFTIASGGASISAIATQKFGEATKIAGIELRTFLVSTALAGAGLFAAFFLVDNLILKNKTAMAFLKQVGAGLQAVGKAILDFLASPIGIAIEAVVALVAISQLQLIPTITKFGKSLVITGAEAFNGVLDGLRTSIGNFVGAVQGTTVNVADKIGLGSTGKIKQDAAALAASLQGSEADFKNTIEQRNARLAQIDQAIPLADQSKARVTGRKPVGDISALQAEKASILKNVGEITAAREAQQATLASLQGQVATAPTRAAAAGQVLQTTLEKSKGSLTQFAGATQRLSGDAFIRLGQSVSNVGLDAFGQKLTATGNEMFALGGKTLASEAALKGFGGAVNVSGVNLQSIGARASAAGKAMATGLNAAKGAAVGLAATLGPIILITAAIAIAVEAIDAIKTVNDAATKSTKAYADSLKEAIEKLDQLEAKRLALKGQAPQDTGKTTEQLQADRLKDIKKEQNLFAKGSDFVEKKFFGRDDKATLFSGDQLKNEVKDFKTALQAQSKVYDDFAGARKKKQIDAEQELVELQKQRAETAAKGGDTKKVDEQIKATQEQIAQDKALLDGEIDKTNKLAPLATEDIKAKDELLKKLVALRSERDALNKTEIKGVDLPRLGSDVEQAQQKVKTGLDALALGTGLPDEVEGKVKATLSSLQELQKASAISPAEAAAAYTQIASSSQVSAEAQAQALQGVKQAFQDSLKIQVDTNEAAQSDIQKKVAEGGLTQQEAEEATTTLKKQQLDIQLQNLRDSVAEEQRIRGVQLADTLASIDKGIQEAQDAAAKHPEDTAAQKLADTAATDGLAKKKSAQDAYDNFVKRSNQDLSTTEAKNSAESAKLTADQKLKTLEYQSKKAQDIAKKAETEREIEVAKLENSGQITHAEAEQAKASTTAASTNRQIEIEKIRLKELQKNEKGNEVAIRESKQKLLDLTKQSLANEQQAYEAYIGVLKEKLTNLAQAYANALEVGSQDLQRQITLYDSLAKALEQRNTLLKAATDLTNASAGYLTGELDALAKTEKSEFRKRELAQITASIKLEALRQEQAIGEITFKIEQEKNRLALERRDIENQIAIAKTKGELAQGAADLRVAEEQRKAGKITQGEFDAKKLGLQAKFIGLQGLEQERGLIQREKAIQPVLEAAEKRKFEFKQRSDLTNAEVAAFDTLSPGEQANRRDAFQGRVASQISGGRFNSRDALVDGLLPTARQTIDDSLTGKPPSGTNLLATLDPKSQQLLAQLNPNQVPLPTALSTDVPADLTKVTNQIFDGAKFLRGQENDRRELLGQSALANQTIKALPTALQSAQPALSLPPLDTRQQPIQQVQNAVGERQKIESRISEAQERLQAKAGNTVNLPSVTINVSLQGTDKAKAQQTGKAFADELEKVIRQAEALSTR